MQPTLAWLGQQEMLIIFLIVLLLFGAKKLPELAKGLGKSAGEFKKAKDEFNREIQSASEEAERDWDRDVVDPKEAPSKVAAAGSETQDKEA
ncbi:MAG: twin-arginine translocase TatA/TatE family subunit [Verrucomicrobiales bacterium]